MEILSLHVTPCQTAIREFSWTQDSGEGDTEPSVVMRLTAHERSPQWCGLLT